MAGTKPIEQSTEVVIADANDVIDGSVDVLKAFGITPEHLKQVWANMLIGNPALAKCSPHSLKVAAVTACQAGLMPDGRQAVVAPFNQVATFIPMVAGLLMRARQNYPGISIQVHNVYEGDEWKDIRGTHTELIHVANPTCDRSYQSLTASYATAYLAGVTIPEIEVMYRAELERFNKARSGSKGPWASHPGEMCKVRVLKRLLKRLPNLGMMMRSVLDDDDDYDGVTIDADASEFNEFADIPDDPPPAPKARRRSRKAKPAAETDEPAPRLADFHDERMNQVGRIEDDDIPVIDDDFPEPKQPVSASGDEGPY